MKRDDGFVKDGSTKFRLDGDMVRVIRIHWRRDGSFYRSENAWPREEAWAAEVKRLRALIGTMRNKTLEEAARFCETHGQGHDYAEKLRGLKTTKSARKRK